MASENIEGKMIFEEFRTETRRHGEHRGRKRSKTREPHSPLPTPLFVPRTLGSMCLCVILFFSCQSAPQLTEMFLEGTNRIPLDSGASVYIFADVGAVRPVLELLPFEELDNRHVRQMIERTDFAAIALFPPANESPASRGRFQIAAEGNYPAFGAGFALTFNRHWRRQRCETGRFWFSEANGLSLSITGDQLFAAASAANVPSSPFAAAPGIAVPEGFSSFSRHAPFSSWVNAPELMLNSLLESAGVPLRFPAQELFINLYVLQDNQYQAVLRILFENAAQARGISASLALAGRWFVPLNSNSIFAALLFANPPVQNGRNLDIRTAALSENELVMLLQMLRGLFFQD